MSLSPEDGGLYTRIAMIEERIAQLERVDRLISASIGAGGLQLLDGGSISVNDGGSITVKDNNDVTRVKLGVDDGDYDVSLFDDSGGGKIALSNVVRGIAADSSPNLLSTTSATFTSLTGGPEVTVEVGESGTVFVLYGAALAAKSDGTLKIDSEMAYDISGANTDTAPVEGVVTNDIKNVSGGTTIVGSTDTRGELLTGLNPGSTTFATRYRRIILNGPDSFQAQFTQPWIIVIPL